MADDTLLIDGAALPDGVTLDWPYEWPYAGAEPRGDAIEYPGIDGGQIGDQPYPARILSIPVSLHPPDGDCWPTDPAVAMAYANARRRALLAVCKPGRDVTLTRRMTFPGATMDDAPVQEDQTARARFINAPLTRPTVEVNRVALEWVMLDGLWYGPENTVGTGAVEVSGEVRTHRLTVTLAGGTNAVLTNATNGYSLAYAGASGAGVIIDVEAMTVTGGPTSALSWTRRLPFALEPGDNTLVITSGTASLDYRPAYL